jgi:hypothetical protein
VVEEAAVGCRGVLFAIDQDEIRALWQATSDKEFGLSSPPSSSTGTSDSSP